MTNNATPDPGLIRILLVDDDENAHPLISHLLAKVPGKKFSIEWASDYETGSEAIGRQAHDVYLVDYRLGMQNGLDLLRKAISLGASGPIIILTEAADPRVDLEATRIGAADFLLKDKLDSTTLERSIRYSIQHFATLRALQKSTERFRLLFERSMDAIFISDDQGGFLEVNGAACNLLGYSHDELLKRKVSELLVTDFPELLRNQSFGELAFTQTDGEMRYAEYSSCRFAPNLNLCILRDVTDRRMLEQEIQEISEREQRRLGQDLHDGLGQALTGIGFLSKVLQQKLAAKGVEEAKDAGNIATLLSQALQQTRELARGLCPVVLEKNDIHAALQQLADNMEKYLGIEADMEFDPRVRIDDNAVAVHLYRIAQEATTNSMKHGKARKIHISLKQIDGTLTLHVRDDGVGCPPDLQGKGMGMRVMQHRARMINAVLEVQCPKEGGTLVSCCLQNKGTAARRHERRLSAKRKAVLASASND